MASNLNQYEFFNFYTRYRWQPADFESFEELFRQFVQASNRRAPTSVVRGYNFASATGFNISVAAGLAFNEDGFPLHKSSATSVATTGSNALNVRWNLIVARKKATNANNITEPTNPTNTVPLNTIEECEIVSIPGTLGDPKYPAKVAGDVILFGIKIPAAATDVLSSYIDYTVTEYPFKTGDDQKYFRLFDAVVGSGRFCTHKTLNDVMADADIANIKDILVSEGYTIDSVQTINQANKRIVFKSGSTLLKGTAASGMVVSAAGVIIENARMSGFNGVGDVPIGFDSGADYGVLNMVRLHNSNDIIDNTVNGISTVALVMEA